MDHASEPERGRLAAVDALVKRLEARLGGLFERIRSVAEAAGRPGSEIQLIAVTKYATAIETSAVGRALERLERPVLLGESRVQDLSQKIAALSGEELAVHWEMIGSIQRNKSRAALRQASRIHSLDRDDIIRRLSAQAVEEDRVVAGLIQVNISGEAAKHGYLPDRVGAALELASSLPAIRIQGLMGMAARGSTHDSARPAFASLRELKERLAPALPHLSMGMSQDYVGAIKEGATLLRVGSALFASEEIE
ncbi:MAG: YggS family pyridoxal phosphate-dependent enzyme [Planctomycetota bacterium]